MNLKQLKITVEVIALIIVLICIIADITLPSFMINFFILMGAWTSTSLAIALILVIIVLPFYIYDKIKKK